MEQVEILRELALIAVLAVAVTVIFSRVRLPTVAGLLSAGALLGPYGFGLVHGVHTIEVLAEVGVVLLLFSIGLEFSLARLRVIFRQVALGGVLQVALTTLATMAIALAVGEPIHHALFFGFVFALSSTAIVLRGLTERRELNAPHGRFIVGTLIFQDLCVVPMVLIIPLLGTVGEIGGVSGGAAVVGIGWAMLKAAVVVAGTLFLARYVVPRMLGWVDASGSREVFLLAILTLCIGTAWLTSLVGLSLALGAFLGGMVVADTEYGHRAMGDILPLRDTFVSIFFVSLGMLFDVRVLLDQPAMVFLLLLGFVIGKGILGTVAALAMRFPARVAWLAGVGLAQFGEFGFVLVRLGETHNVIDAATVGPILAAGILSMFLTPLLVRAAPHISAGEKLLAPLERLLGVRGIDEMEESESSLRHHVVIVGFGIAGRFAAQTLAACGEPFVVLELNAENVRAGKAAGLPVYYADATSAEALGHAQLDQARLLVLLMNDPLAVRRVVDTARRVAPHVGVLVRTRLLSERPGFFEIGAHDVVAEEVEGAVEMIARMLRWIEAPRNVMDQRIRDIRRDTHSSDRKQTLPRSALRDQRGLDEMKIESVIVRAGSRVEGASPASLQLRSTTGVLVVGVRRQERLLEDPDPRVTFDAGDIVYMVGTTEAMRSAVPWFEPSVTPDSGGPV